MHIEDSTSRGGPPDGRADRVPLSGAGLVLHVDAISSGLLSPAIRLQVFSHTRATSIGATLPASQAERLASAILDAARRAVAEAESAGPDAAPSA